MQCGVLTAEVSIRYAATMFRLSVFVCTRMMYLLKCCNSCMRMKQMISNNGNYIYFVVYKIILLKNSVCVSEMQIGQKYLLIAVKSGSLW